MVRNGQQKEIFAEVKRGLLSNSKDAKINKLKNKGGRIKWKLGKEMTKLETKTKVRILFHSIMAIFSTIVANYR